MIAIDAACISFFNLDVIIKPEAIGMNKKTKKIFPFVNEADSLGIGGLTIENRIDRISLYGSIDITRDREGLVYAERLKLIFDDIVAAMQADHLPDKISIKPAEEIANPFADDAGQ
jgi:hypothetical protein